MGAPVGISKSQEGVILFVEKGGDVIWMLTVENDTEVLCALEVLDNVFGGIDMPLDGVILIGREKRRHCG